MRLNDINRFLSKCLCQNWLLKYKYWKWGSNVRDSLQFSSLYSMNLICSVKKVVFCNFFFSTIDIKISVLGY